MRALSSVSLVVVPVVSLTMEVAVARMGLLSAITPLLFSFAADCLSLPPMLSAPRLPEEAGMGGGV